MCAKEHVLVHWGLDSSATLLVLSYQSSTCISAANRRYRPNGALVGVGSVRAEGGARIVPPASGWSARQLGAGVFPIGKC